MWLQKFLNLLRNILLLGRRAGLMAMLDLARLLVACMPVVLWDFQH